MKQSIDVLLIAAVKDELDSVRAAESDWQPRQDSKGFSYYIRTETGRTGQPFSIAAARPVDMGGDFAAIHTTRLVNELEPRCLAMVGICAGRRGDVFLGDIVVAERVFRYDVGKVQAFLNKEGIVEELVYRDIRTYNLDPRWIQKAQDFAPNWAGTIRTLRPLTYNYQELWLLYAIEAFEAGRGDDPIESSQRITHCPDWTLVMQRLKDRRLIKARGLALTKKGKAFVAEHKIHYPDGIPQEPAQPQIHVAPMGTVNQVIKNPRLFSDIAQHVRKVLALEMEAAAIGAVAEIEGVDSCIIAKAVADYADMDKNDQFRWYAIEASYRFMIAFLEENLPPLDKRNEHTTSRPVLAKQEHVGKKTQHVQAIKDEISLGHLKQALEYYRQLDEAMAISLLARLSRITKDMSLGLITYAQANAEENAIVLSLLEGLKN